MDRWTEARILPTNLPCQSVTAACRRRAGGWRKVPRATRATTVSAPIDNNLRPSEPPRGAHAPGLATAHPVRMKGFEGAAPASGGDVPANHKSGERLGMRLGDLVQTRRRRRRFCSCPCRASLSPAPASQLRRLCLPTCASPPAGTAFTASVLVIGAVVRLEAHEQATARSESGANVHTLLAAPRDSPCAINPCLLAAGRRRRAGSTQCGCLARLGRRLALAGRCMPFPPAPTFEPNVTPLQN